VVLGVAVTELEDDVNVLEDDAIVLEDDVVVVPKDDVLEDDVLEEDMLVGNAPTPVVPLFVSLIGGTIQPMLDAFLSPSNQTEAILAYPMSLGCIPSLRLLLFNPVDGFCISTRMSLLWLVVTRSSITAGKAALKARAFDSPAGFTAILFSGVSCATTMTASGHAIVHSSIRLPSLAGAVVRLLFCSISFVPAMSRITFGCCGRLSSAFVLIWSIK